MCISSQRADDEYMDDFCSWRVQPEPEMHDMFNMLTSLPEHSNVNWSKDYIEPETESESTIDESDAFLKINLNNDHTSIIIKDSKEPIDSFNDDISFEDDHEVDIEYKNLTLYSPQRFLLIPSPKALKISKYSSSRRTPSPDSFDSSTTHPASLRSGMMTPVKLEYPTTEKEDPPELNMKN